MKRHRINPKSTEEAISMNDSSQGNYAIREYYTKLFKKEQLWWKGKCENLVGGVWKI